MKKKILLIEDQAGFRKVYTDVLENNGFEVIAAEDGEKGWSLAQSELPDLILLDLILPKMTGMDVLRRIRIDQKTNDIPVLVLSVLGDKEVIAEALSKGANDYTIKGFYTPREILAKMAPLLAIGRVEQKTAVELESVVTHKIEFNAKTAEAKKLLVELGVGESGVCPVCKTALVLEVSSDVPHIRGHWFKAALACDKCRENY